MGSVLCKVLLNVLVPHKYIKYILITFSSISEVSFDSLLGRFTLLVLKLPHNGVDIWKVQCRLVREQQERYKTFLLPNSEYA